LPCARFPHPSWVIIQPFRLWKAMPGRVPACCALACWCRRHGMGWASIGVGGICCDCLAIAQAPLWPCWTWPHWRQQQKPPAAQAARHGHAHGMWRCWSRLWPSARYRSG